MSELAAHKPFDVFISYYQNTGKDFARCLKVGLKDFEMTAFRDVDDIPNIINTDSDEWRKYVDSAIKESPNFVLIMTVGFNKRPEIARELKLAFESGKKKIIFMKESDLPSTDLIIEIDGKPKDLSKLKYIPFSSDSELLRKVISALLGKIGESQETNFSKQVNSMINTEGVGFARDSPSVQMIVGPTVDSTEWLLPTPENKWLVSCFPYYIGNVQARRTFFEAMNEQPPHRVFLKVTTNGFYHTIVELIRENQRPNQPEERFSFDLVFAQMTQPLLFAIRLMKDHNLNSDQTVTYLLKNLGDKLIDFGKWASFRQYSFTSSPIIGGFTYNFNSQQGWNEIGIMLLKIYKDLCLEAGCVNIEDRVIRQRVGQMLYNFEELQMSYSFQGFSLPNIDVASFGLEDIKR